MTDVLKKYLCRLLNKVDGLYAIVITDRDGVPVAQVTTENCPEQARIASYLASFCAVGDQARKMALGKLNRTICMFSTYQVVHFDKAPLYLIVIGSSSASTGLLLSLESDLDEVIRELKTAISEV